MAVRMRNNATTEKLTAACEHVLRHAVHPEDVTVRSIVALAGTNVSAVSYHFGSLERLIFSVAQRAYLQLNAERLALLQAAVQRARPEPAPAGELIAALIGPSIRWSLDPSSNYPILRHMTSIAQSSHHPEIFRPMIEDVEHHLVFIPHFRRIAPWLTDVEIGFRISCLLGVRSQLTRNRARTEELTDHAMDLGDAEALIAHVVAATEAMFTTPPSASSNSVRNRSRH